ncbi:hypothetical protein AVEN_60509-1 [Araneus ventricosus]|uniref:Uncharacterized protein n=1 Tax=Araneus ventricosus TaxID=182803 RepID=A0A4Y2GAU5_ARAVE|nr:hypothetical protein AVEN_60509-1 [Araneus ventricosus]
MAEFQTIFVYQETAERPHLDYENRTISRTQKPFFKRQPNCSIKAIYRQDRHSDGKGGLLIALIPSYLFNASLCNYQFQILKHHVKNDTRDNTQTIYAFTKLLASLPQQAQLWIKQRAIVRASRLPISATAGSSSVACGSCAGLFATAPSGTSVWPLTWTVFCFAYLFRSCPRVARLRNGRSTTTNPSFYERSVIGSEFGARGALPCSVGSLLFCYSLYSF